MRAGNVKMAAGAASGLLFNPNGVALSAARDALYVTNRGRSSADADSARTIYAFDLTPSSIRNGEVFAYVDGVKVDEDGRVYAGVTGSVDVFSVDGTLLGKIKVAEGDVAVNMVLMDHWLYIVGRVRNFLYQFLENASSSCRDMY